VKLESPGELILYVWGVFIWSQYYFHTIISFWEWSFCSTGKDHSIWEDLSLIISWTATGIYNYGSHFSSSNYFLQRLCVNTLWSQPQEKSLFDAASGFHTTSRTKSSCRESSYLQRKFKPIKLKNDIIIFSHCSSIRSNIKQMGPLQFCLPVFLGIHRNPKQKDFFNLREGFLR
jgi:hypothetical protein